MSISHIHSCPLQICKVSKSSRVNVLQQSLHHSLSLKWVQSHQTTEDEILNTVHKLYFLISTLFHFTTTVDEDGDVNRNARLLFYFLIIDECDTSLSRKMHVQ